MQIEAAMNKIKRFKLTFHEEDVVNQLSFAAVALSVNDSLQTYAEVFLGF